MAFKTVISVIGPTAIGKTAAAIAIAKHFSTEIIAADSRQFYKEMSIGTAVPTQRELELVPHHFIQHKSIHERYTVGDYERDALQLLDTFFHKKDIMVLVGGSGLFVDAVLNGLDDFPTVDPKIRQSLQKLRDEQGLPQLQKQLKALDKVYYEKVDLDNPQRVIRALEICLGTGKPYSSFLHLGNRKRNFEHLGIGLHADRALVYARINERVDTMMEAGLLEEARGLIPYKHLSALQTVGYKELFAYFDGTWEYDFAVSEIKKNTRRFAKRQLTWFKKSRDVLWVNHDIASDVLVSKIHNTLGNLQHG